ncbi:hypothetical protein V6N13_069044 [Hibiscus sabdariffa]
MNISTFDLKPTLSALIQKYNYVGNIVIRVGCVISDDDYSLSSSSDKSRPIGPFSYLFSLVFREIIKPLQALGQFFNLKQSILNGTLNAHSSSSKSVGSGGGDDGELDQGGVTHHFPRQMLRNFKKIRFLLIKLPSLILTYAYGQGVLRMNRDPLEELIVKPLSASSASKRT